MKLCLYSNTPLDELEIILKDKFSLIENKNVEEPDYSIPENYPKSSLGKIVKMESIKDISELNIIWILKNYEKDTEYPLNYITHVLGHKGKLHSLTFA
jgi:secreted Zn-dependent insulinase-like peptidase